MPLSLAVSMIRHVRMSLRVGRSLRLSLGIRLRLSISVGISISSVTIVQMVSHSEATPISKFRFIL